MGAAAGTPFAVHSGRRLTPKGSVTMSKQKKSAPAPAAAVRRTTPPPVSAPMRSVPLAAVPEEQVRLCAYRKWQAAGCPPGDGVAFWLEAERELGHR
jgi:hypothetical protein